VLLSADADTQNAENDLVGHGLNSDGGKLLVGVDANALYRSVVIVIEVEYFGLGGQGGGNPVVDADGVNQLGGRFRTVCIGDGDPGVFHTGVHPVGAGNEADSHFLTLAFQRECNAVGEGIIDGHAG